jgi:hypothetical protein
MPNPARMAMNAAGRRYMHCLCIPKKSLPECFTPDDANRAEITLNMVTFLCLDWCRLTLLRIKIIKPKSFITE